MGWDGAYYKEHGYVQKGVALQQLAAVPFKGNERILDIGCGSGDLTARIAALVPEGEVIGIDLSSSMLDEAMLLTQGSPRLCFRQMSADDFAFPDPFDLITSFAALHWVKDHGAVLRCCRTALKRGGRIFFLFVSGRNPFIHDMIKNEVWGAHMAGQPERFYLTTQEEYEVLLPSYGFQCEEIEQIASTICFATPALLASHLMTWLPYYTHLAPKLCQQLADEIAQSVAASQAATKDILFTTPLLKVKARLL